MAAPDERQSSGSLEPKGAGSTGVIDGFLKSPFAGIAPWVLMSILSGPGRFEESVAAALGFTLMVLWLGYRRGIRIHVLEVFGAAFFAVLALIGVFSSEGMLRWLELWAGELTNISLAVFAWVTLLVGRPFTVAYAKDTVPREYWDSLLFKRVNDRITAVWAGAFTFAAAVGFIGDLIYRDSDNFWTGWILQLAATFFAIAFTEFYPDYASAKSALGNGEPAKVPSVLQIVDWLPFFVLVTGIVGLTTDSVDSALGWTLIIVGAIGSGILRFALLNVDKSVH